MQHDPELVKEYINLKQLSYKFDDYRVRQDFHKLIDAAHAKWRLLDRELIVCRRSQNPSRRYQELEQEFRDHLKLISKFATMQVLRIRKH
jgi:hypothetical protein